MQGYAAALGRVVALPQRQKVIDDLAWLQAMQARPSDERSDEDNALMKKTALRLRNNDLKTIRLTRERQKNVDELHRSRDETGQTPISHSTPAVGSPLPATPTLDIAFERAH